MRSARLLTAAAVGAAALIAIGAHGADVLGQKPKYLLFGPSGVPNAPAIVKMIWAPGLDDGFVPQGIAVAGETVLLSAYKSTDPKVGRGPCRIFRIAPETGAYTGVFDLPPDCGHAGGLAYLGNDALVVADTRRVYRVDLTKAFDERSASAVTSAVTLAGDVKGSFADFDGTDLWLGVYDKEESRSSHRGRRSIATGTSGSPRAAAASGRSTSSIAARGGSSRRTRW